MFKIGADPELFLKSSTTNEFVSAEDQRGPLIPGTKSDPFAVKSGAVQVDGVAAEFNINPSKSFDEFFGNIKDVVSEMKTMIKKKDDTLNLIPVPTATFKEDYFRSLPEHTLQLGCEPDFNAYKDGEANPRPQTDEPFRTGSGHVHMSWYSPKNFVEPFSEGHIKDCCLVTKQLDKFLLFASQDWDKDNKRRSLYGAPGSFRPKKYGMEYRPLSNAWLKQTRTVKDVYFITLGVLRGMDSAKLDLDADIDKAYGDTNTEKALSVLYQWIPEYYS